MTLVGGSHNAQPGFGDRPTRAVTPEVGRFWASRAPVSGPSLFHLIMLVWGESYVGLMTEVGLPALLSDGNIPALAAAYPVIFNFYTRPQDVPQITASPAYSYLRELAEVRILPFDPTNAHDKYAAMTQCHKTALVEAAREDAAVVFLAPDTVWADGSLRTVAAAAKAGKRVLVQGGLRVRKAEALSDLRARYPDSGRGSIAVPPRALVRLALDHMSADFKAWFWDAPGFSRNPANVYWRVGNEGLVARCFHLHPLMIYPEREVADFLSTVDDDLPLIACPRYDSVYVVEDSDEVFHVDLFDADPYEGLHTLSDGPNAKYLVQWALHCANLHHRRFVRHRLRWHAEPVADGWTEVEAASDRVIRNIRWRFRWREMRVRIFCALYRVKLAAILDAAARRRVGWDLQPDPPFWHRGVIKAARALGLSHAETTFEQHRRMAFAGGVAWLFGSNVTSRGLEGFDPRARQRREKHGHKNWRALVRDIKDLGSELRLIIVALALLTRPSRFRSAVGQLQHSSQRTLKISRRIVKHSARYQQRRPLAHRGRTRYEHSRRSYRQTLKAIARTRARTLRDIDVFRSRGVKFVRRERRVVRKKIYRIGEQTQRSVLTSVRRVTRRPRWTQQVGRRFSVLRRTVIGVLKGHAGPPSP